MDDKLFDIFSKETDAPECVWRRVNETLEMIENSAESDKGYQKEERTGKVINGTDRIGKISTRKKSRKKNWKRSLILSFADVMAFGATVFAAEKYIGISSFFGAANTKMPEEVQEMIEKEPVQQEEGDSILTYTVKEALCDKNSVRVVVEARAKERGKYLLVGEDFNDEDLVSDLGMESDKTIGEYAKEKGLTVVKVGASFDYNSNLGIISAVRDYKSEEEDVLYIYSSAGKANQGGNLMVSCVGTAALPDAKSTEDIMRTTITFQMEDKSQGTTVTYVPEDPQKDAVTADGKIKILSADVEQTEIANYVTVHYILMGKDFTYFLEAADAEGNSWTWSDIGGGGDEKPQTGQEAIWRLTYEKADLTDEIGIFAYDYENNITYETVKMKRQE